MRTLDRQIYGIQREEQKVFFFIYFCFVFFLSFKIFYFQITKEIKDAAKKGDREVCVILAKSLLESRKVNFEEKYKKILSSRKNQQNIFIKL